MIRSPAVWPRKRERGAQSYSRSGSRSRILCLCLADPAPPIIESCAGSCLINAFAPVIKMKNTGVRDDRHCKHRNLALHYRYYLSNKRKDIVCKCSFQGNETVDSQWQTKQSLCPKRQSPGQHHPPSQHGATCYVSSRRMEIG